MNYVVNVEAAIVRDDRYLLIVRGANESHAPGMLSLPGGKVEQAGNTLDILEATLRREVDEEVGVEIENSPTYLESTAFVADDGEPVINIVFLCRYRAGDVRPVAAEEVAQVTWMTAAEVLANPRTPPWLRRSVELAERRGS
jgi:ADP-ribose pyrophosphatase YjhB (NUDIX family)